MSPDLTLDDQADASLPKHATDKWPVAEGHQIPDEDWAKIVADVESQSQRRGFVSLDKFRTYSPYPGSAGRKDSGPNTVVPAKGDDVYVIHTMECPLRAGYAWSLAQWSANSTVQASWRGASDPGGFVWYVPKDRAAWHATWVNRIWKGYEQAGYAAFDRATWLSPLGRASIDFLAQALVLDGIQPGSVRRVTDAEVARRKNGDQTPIRGLVAHAQIQPHDRTDPGAGYPWDYLFERIRFHLNPNNTEGEDDMAMTDAERAALAKAIGREVALALVETKIGEGSLDAPANIGWGLYRMQSELMRIRQTMTGLVTALNRESKL